MESYPSLMMKLVLKSLDDCNESLMMLEDEVSEDLWKDLSEVFAGIGQAIEALDYVVGHPEDYS